MSDNLKEIEDDNFQTEVLDSELPVLVDFTAIWCGPCQKQTSILEQFAKDQIGKIKVVKIDIDQNIKTTAQYVVRSIPTLMLFKNGRIFDTKIGLTPNSGLLNMLDKLL